MLSTHETKFFLKKERIKMKLASWMKLNDLSYRELAKKLKINHTTLYRYVNGQRKVPLKIAILIEKYTEGNVPMKDMV
jgi:transcriptional regulator with XRE-family HTH domain